MIVHFIYAHGIDERLYIEHLFLYILVTILGYLEWNLGKVSEELGKDSGLEHG